MASQWYPSIRPLEYRGYRWACDRGTREWSWKKLTKTIWVSRLVNVMLLRSVLRLWLCIRVDWCLAIQFGGILIPSHQSRVGWAERSMKPWNWPNIPDPVYQHECHGGCFDSADDVVFFLFPPVLWHVDWNLQNITVCQFELSLRKAEKKRHGTKQDHGRFCQALPRSFGMIRRSCCQCCVCIIQVEKWSTQSRFAYSLKYFGG